MVHAAAVKQRTCPADRHLCSSVYAMYFKEPPEKLAVEELMGCLNWTRSVKHEYFNAYAEMSPVLL